MRYCPVPSLTTVRVFSMSAGLDASTVTPGSTAADASRTTPAIVAWAKTRLGSSKTPATAATTFTTGYIDDLLEPSPASRRCGNRATLSHLTRPEPRDNLCEIASTFKIQLPTSKRRRRNWICGVEGWELEVGS